MTSRTLGHGVSIQLVEPSKNLSSTIRVFVLGYYSGRCEREAMQPDYRGHEQSH